MPADAIDIEAARQAHPLWAVLPSTARARYIRRAAVALLDELDELAPRLADETGWPVSQLLLSELLPAAQQGTAGVGELLDLKINDLRTAAPAPAAPAAPAAPETPAKP